VVALVLAPLCDGLIRVFSSFMTTAWISGTLVAVVAGAVGFFVVLRRAAFAAHAIPNGAFAGAAGANLVGLNPLVGLAGFALAAAYVIGAASKRERTDVTTALALVLMLALGAAFLSLSTQYEAQITSLLFGEILGVSTSQLLPVALVAAGCTLALGVMYRPLLLSSLSAELAVARGISTVMMETGFLVVVALTTALTVPVVGALLTFSLMIGPPAAARCLAARPARAVILSVVLALVTVWASIASSYLWNWPVGFFVGSYGAVVYVGARVTQSVAGRTTPRTARVHGDLSECVE